MRTMRPPAEARPYSVERFGLVGSCAVYGDSLDTSEDSPRSPVSLNGVTKLLNELAVESFSESHSIDLQIYRVFNTYGGSDRFSVLSHLRRAVDEDVPFVLNNA